MARICSRSRPKERASARIARPLSAAGSPTSTSSAAVSEVCEIAVSATLTSARVRRTLINGFFGVTRDRAHGSPSYAQLLASNARGRAYLTQNKKSFSVPVITKPADYTSAGDRAECDFEFALRAENIYALACAGYNPLASTPFQS